MKRFATNFIANPFVLAIAIWLMVLVLALGLAGISKAVADDATWETGTLYPMGVYERQVALFFPNQPAYNVYLVPEPMVMAQVGTEYNRRAVNAYLVVTDVRYCERTSRGPHWFEGVVYIPIEAATGRLYVELAELWLDTDTGARCTPNADL